MPDAAEHALIAQADAPRVDRCVSRDIQAVLEAQHESRLSLDALYAYPPSSSRTRAHRAWRRAEGRTRWFGPAPPALLLLWVPLRRYGRTAGCRRASGKRTVQSLGCQVGVTTENEQDSTVAA